MNYKVLAGSAAAVLAGIVLYNSRRYGVQDLSALGQGPLEQIFAPIGHTLNIMLYGNDRWIYAIPGAVELAGLAGIVAGIKMNGDK